MTWRTQVGNRVLKGSEAAVFGNAAWGFADEIYLGTDFISGIPVFDHLRPEQQLAVLAEVTEALLVETESCPEHTAINEGAIAAVFGHLRVAVELEADYDTDEPIEGDPTLYRRLVLTAVKDIYDEVERQEGDDFDRESLDGLLGIDVTSQDVEHWSDLIAELEDQILWDSDYADPLLEAYHDEPSGTGQADYFTAKAPEVTADEKKHLHQKIANLCRDFE